MAIPKNPPPTLQLVAIFSQYERAIDWGIERVACHWGEVELRSQRFEHGETAYYEREMGSGLLKQFLLLKAAYDPARLADSKLESNSWEEELSRQEQFEVDRPINIDPGYLTLSKLVLASAKDRAHRIYLRDGIYAEECLYYLDHKWQPRPWTYPDYRRTDFQAFFVQAREFLKQQISAGLQ